MLGDEAGQRHGEIEPHRHRPAARVGEAIHLLFRFAAPLADQDFFVFQRRRVDRAETVGAINPPGRFDQPFARNHRLGQIIAKSLERARFDHGVRV